MHFLATLTFTAATLVASTSTADKSQGIAVGLCTTPYVLRFIAPQGWRFDEDRGELWPTEGAKVKSGPVWLHCILPPRDRDYTDFDERTKKEIRIARQVERNVIVRRRHLGTLRAVEIRSDGFVYDPNPHRTLITTLVGVPSDLGGGEIFVIGIDTSSHEDLLVYQRVYEHIMRSGTVSRAVQ